MVFVIEHKDDEVCHTEALKEFSSVLTAQAMYVLIISFISSFYITFIWETMQHLGQCLPGKSAIQFKYFLYLFCNSV